MRVAYIITRADDVGGGQVHVRDLAGALLAHDHEVTVLAGGSGRFFKELDALRIPRRSLRNLAMPISPAKDLWALFEIIRALREIRPDIVATHSAKAGLLGRAAAALVGVPAVFTPHGWSISDRISASRGKIFRLLERLAARFTARIINVCEYERSLAQKYHVAGLERLAMVHNGLADVDETLRADVSLKPPRLAMIARMAPPKDHETLLRALSGLRDLPWTLDLIGDGPLETHLQRQASRLGIQNRVRFLGFHSQPERLLRDSQIFVLTSRSEAFPYCILEAMRAGLPVVATAVGGIGEAVVAGHSGLLSPVEDVNALQQNLALLIGDAELRKEYGKNGRRRYESHFTFDEMFRRTFQVYKESVASSSAVVAQRVIN